MPKISIIIVNYNGKKWLNDCLSSIEKQTYTNYEVIFVDNNSFDGSVEYVRKHFSNTKIIENKKNLGFAGGNNAGYKASNGEILLFLNNDTYFDKDFLKEYVKVFDDEKVAIAQSKLVLTDENTIDSCGSFWTDTTFMYYYGNGKNASLDKYNKKFKVFSIKGASFMVRREVIERIGLFDEDFWNYYEETDFCHRAWIAGYQSWYCPNAVCYHAQGGTSLSFPNDYIQYHNFKNKLASFIKNFEVINLIKFIPIFLIFNVFIGFYWLAKGKWKHTLSLYKAFFWNIKNIKNLTQKRKNVQNLRRVSDNTYLEKVTVNPSIKYYYYLLTMNMGKYQDAQI